MHHIRSDNTELPPAVCRPPLRGRGCGRRRGRPAACAPPTRVRACGRGAAGWRWGESPAPAGRLLVGARGSGRALLASHGRRRWRRTGGGSNRSGHGRGGRAATTPRQRRQQPVNPTTGRRRSHRDQAGRDNVQLGGAGRSGGAETDRWVHRGAWATAGQGATPRPRRVARRQALAALRGHPPRAPAAAPQRGPRGWVCR